MRAISAEKLVARVASSYLTTVARTVTVEALRADTSGATARPPTELAEWLRAQLLAPTPSLFPFWNAHSLAVLTALIPLVKEGVSNRVEAVVDDSFGGIVTQRVLSFCKIRARILRHSSPAARLEDLKHILSERPSLFLALDSHGPYRTVNSGLARLWRVYEGQVFPIVAACDRKIRLFKQVKMLLPLPGATIRLAIATNPLWMHDLTVSETQARLHSTMQCLEDLAAQPSASTS